MHIRERMSKLAGITFIVAFLSVNVLAQQDSKLTQSMFLVPIYNPGAVGQSEKICIAGTFRDQWGGLPGAPRLVNFHAHTPFNLFGRSHGAGISFTSDELALNTDIYINLAYSFKIDLGSGVLGAGFNAGIIDYSFDPSGLNGANVIETTGDPAIPTEDDFPPRFDMAIGAFYSTDQLYFGLSSTHVNQALLKTRDQVANPAQPRLVRHYYAIGGYTLQLANPAFELMPSFLLQTDLNDYHIYLNTNLRYNKRFWGGVSYSVGGAISALLGVELMNGIKLGYSYDIELSPLFKYNSGSHEITVRYCFDLSKDKSPEKYESIRFL